MAERLKLVTEFSQLRAGDLVVIRPCGHCGKTHRGMLVEWDDGPGIMADGSILPRVPSWIFHPTPSNGRHARYPFAAISAYAVARREVFKVDTGLSLDTTEETSRPLEAVR